jgi:hypothetical protein
MAEDRENHNNAMTLTEPDTEIRHLQAKVTTMDKEKADKEDNHDEDEINDSQPLAQVPWDAIVPENFKTPHLPTFDGKSDPSEHMMVVGTQTAIIGATYHPKCKLLSGTLKEAALRWYMNLPKHSIESWLDFNESQAQKPATSMQEIIKRAECYIKGEESNAEKRT